jgi:hypothetical protein
MKNREMFLVLILLIFTTCIEKDNKNRDLANIMNKSLIDKIEEVVDEFEGRYKYPIKEKKIIAISFDDYSNCLIKISTDYYYNTDRIDGYTFFDGNLIVFYNAHSICNKDIVNINNLTIFKDSISGYKDYSQLNMDYETITRLYKIVNKDSPSLDLVPLDSQSEDN